MNQALVGSRGFPVWVVPVLPEMVVISDFARGAVPRNSLTTRHIPCLTVSTSSRVRPSLVRSCLTLGGS